MPMTARLLTGRNGKGPKGKAKPELATVMCPACASVVDVARAAAVLPFALRKPGTLPAAKKHTGEVLEDVKGNAPRARDQETAEVTKDETARSGADQMSQMIIWGGLGALALLVMGVVPPWVSLGGLSMEGIGLGFWTMLVLAAGLAAGAGIELMLAVKKRWSLSLWESAFVGTYGIAWFFIFIINAATMAGVGI